MSDFDKTKMTLSYEGFGRSINIKLDGEEADYLPKVMATFAEFCRSVGFVWVAVEQIEGENIKGYKVKNYLFRGNYKWDDSTEWAETYNNSTMEDWPQFDEEEQQDVINEAADNYWDTEDTDNYRELRVDPLSPYVGDSVYYAGNGTENDQTGHCGYKGVPLHNMKGVVVKTKDNVLGPKALVKFHNWHDGHNGLGDDPKARIKDDSYFWVFTDNLVGI